MVMQTAYYGALFPQNEILDSWKWGESEIILLLFFLNAVYNEVQNVPKG